MRVPSNPGSRAVAALKRPGSDVVDQLASDLFQGRGDLITVNHNQAEALPEQSDGVTLSQA